MGAVCHPTPVVIFIKSVCHKGFKNGVVDVIEVVILKDVDVVRDNNGVKHLLDAFETLLNFDEVGAEVEFFWFIFVFISC